MSSKRYISIFPYNVPAYRKNAVFDVRNNKGIEVLIFATLKTYLKKHKLEINTYDVETPQKPEKYVYLEIPYPWNIRAWKTILLHRQRNILLLNEPPIINPLNYWKILHIFFHKIYTWNDEFVDNKKYFKVLLPKTSLDKNMKPVPFYKKKFLVMINKNTSPFLPFVLLSTFGRELYSERINMIEFFERVAPKDFTLYGRGWNKPKKYKIPERFFGFKKYSSYKGEIDNKIELLSMYKYSICFENLTDVKGYVTEKIIDCLKAKCVPIYWGASDIEKYIPKNCFIDYREFGSYQELLDYLIGIDENEYNAYIKNIERLLADKKFIDLWFEDGFAKFFLEDILEIK